MEPKKIRLITVEQDIHIAASSTDKIVERFKRLIDCDVITPDKALLCTINYVTSLNNVERGPVRIYFSNGTRVKLNLTAGYTGTGPRDTCDILKLCKFDFDENDILRGQNIVAIKYFKDADKRTVYQFTNPDGSHEYSWI